MAEYAVVLGVITLPSSPCLGALSGAILAAVNHVIGFI